MGPERRPPRLLLAALLAATFHARWSLSLSLSFLSFSLLGAGPLLQPQSSLFSAVVSMLLTCPPSLTSVAEGGGGGGGGGLDVPRDTTENTKEKVLLPVEG